MKLEIKFLALLLMITYTAFAQNTVKMTHEYGSGNPEVQEIMDFENMYVEKLNFEGEPIRGKFFMIRLDEYKNGRLKRSSVLFNGSESDYFKIGSDKESLRFYFKMADGKMKTYLKGQKFGSKKSYFKLYEDSERYALKDFFGNKSEYKLDLAQKNPVFAIITPTMHKDGSGSYCEVAQSNVAPENLGEHFKIPHYFIINIEFL